MTTPEQGGPQSAGASATTRRVASALAHTLPVLEWGRPDNGSVLASDPMAAVIAVERAS